VSYVALAETYQEANNLDEALNAFRLAEKYAVAVGAPSELEKTYRGISEVYGLKKNYKEAFTYHKLLEQVKDSIYKDDVGQRLAGLTFGFEIEKKESQIKLQESDIKRQKLAKNSAMAGVASFALIAVIIFRNYKQKVKVNKILDKQKDEIEGLLLNILPAEVAKELQVEGHAEPKFYESATVLFTDFKGFTKLADEMTPQQVIEELSTCFVAFDDIIDKYGVEKIKTIGDSYMCVGGLPISNKTHPFDVIKAALDMQAFINKHNAERAAEGLPAWEIRIGVHTGSLVAGVVGKKKYAYDIWGSTVNIASRMESNGEPGKINISDATYKIIKDQYACRYRGKISAKNIGEIDMYFVERDGIVNEPFTVVSQDIVQN
jgi:adenylate cyclase